MGNIVNRVFESAGPDGKVRGTPQQIIDKYQVLARDAQVSGDRVAAENYLQHAEHYARLLVEAQRQNQEQRPFDRDDRDRDDRDRDDREDEREWRDDGSERPREQSREQPPERREQFADRPREQAADRPREQSPDRPREQQHQQPRRRQQGEPQGLVTIGSDDGDEGPVETPEAGGWPRPAQPPRPVHQARSAQPGHEQPEAPRGLHVVNGEPAEDGRGEPAPPEEGAAPPKRTRSRRKTKPASEVIEASAE